MISVIQRVCSASVSVDGVVVGSINNGLLLFAGLEKGDTEADMEYTARKTAELRIFQDAAGKMNCSVLEAGGAVLAVSQFTLAGSIQKGRRPSFDTAMPPEEAKEKFSRFLSLLSTQGVTTVETGTFGAHMRVSLINDGPVTFVIDSRKRV